MKFTWTAKGSHFGGAGERSEPERVRPRSAALSLKAAQQMPLAVYDPTRENAFGALRRARQTRNKNNSSAEYAQSSAEGIPNRPALLYLSYLY